MLVTVVVVMLVGFVVATIIAATVLFSIRANADNKSNTQAFIAAESGRDAAVAALKDGCVATDLSGSGSTPQFTYAVRTSTGTQPTDYDSITGTACPTENSWVVIRSIGTGLDGSTATIDSVYPWIVSWEQQAGGVLAYYANGVSLRGTYAGDIVVRSGDYTCAADGTLNGDLYVTRGTATFSRDCTVLGDVWTYGDVDGSSQRITITGNVKAGGAVTGGTHPADVTFTANGTTIGTSADPDSGKIEASRNISLTNTGSTDGHVWGDMTAGGTISVGSKWVVDPTAVRSPSTAPPAFDPTLEFIRTVTAWMDLDRASGWSASPVVACSLTSADIMSRLTAAGSADPVVFDYTGCSSVHTNVTLPTGSYDLLRDAAFLMPPAKVSNITVKGSLAGDRQLVFLHEDNSRDLVAGDTAPTCGNGNQRDNFDVDAGLTLNARLMIYSPCGLNGNVKTSFKGQLYSNDTSGVTFIGAASYTCALMQWPPAFEKLGCKVRGEGDDVVTETVKVYRLGDLVYQSEQ
ncbi:hypothetical protein JNB62_10330 [Microbacterium jejuense]|uniref:Tfp pilus assembly protein PilX n=1 Tax=Microbacterium jejuense TaxID=1263637 RepID=A0ABS7HNS3_9MICO|nr:hypothetical protein [Microbacterium jejuense]MBW9094080.1 hypothetical protein [Microbacterium jejuense]